MVMDGFMHLQRGGILKRRSWNNLALERASISGRLNPDTPGGHYLRGAFFLGSQELYEWLAATEAADPDAIDMCAVSNVNQLYGDHQALVAVIDDVADGRMPARRQFGVADALARLGRAMVDNWREARALLGFFGEVLIKLLRMVREPRRFRPVATVFHMEQVGLDAVPLVALLCFLVGAVVAFLGANVLRDFGATIFVVELVSIAFLREFGVLLTAIILAGRTASAFTAQIGAMVSREEIDAMRTLGLDPVDLLVIPRVLALVLTLPLLTFVAIVAGLLGGLTVGAFNLDIPPQQYLTRMQDTMSLRHLWVGLGKAPVFALVISLIGCLEGLQVKGTAQSLGERTTSSVVQSISLVIVLDAFFAIWLMEMGW